MNETTLHLTNEERTFLAELLEKSLKDARIEEHRTRAPSFREFVLRQEALIASLLGKLGQTPA